jgi:hypothetical protein
MNGSMRAADALKLGQKIIQHSNYRPANRTTMRDGPGKNALSRARFSHGKTGETARE